MRDALAEFHPNWHRRQLQEQPLRHARPQCQSHQHDHLPASTLPGIRGSRAAFDCVVMRSNFKMRWL
jgi:hypothetical protein